MGKWSDSLSDLVTGNMFIRDSTLSSGGLRNQSLNQALVLQKET